MNRNSDTSAALGFTLVELLVVLTIISLLATTVLFGLSGVQTNAREQRTKAQIARIHELIAEKWESYETRRISIRPGFGWTQAAWNPPTPRVDRLIGLRDLMRLELPDQITDVATLDGSAFVPHTAPVSGIPQPALNAYYFSIADKQMPFGELNTTAANVESGLEWSPSYQGAECLYMILSRLRVGDSNGLDSFSESEIGDVDNDGMPEILDAWGQPIEFIRWAPAFDIKNYENIENIETFGQSSLNDQVTEDPFDLAAADPRYYAQPSPTFIQPFEMFPLIISGGANREVGVIHAGDPQVASTDFSYSDPTQSALSPDVFSVNDKYDPPSDNGFPCDPYIVDDDNGVKEGFGGRKRADGVFIDDNDDITNHVIETSL